ncbi:MAG: RCC1 repeat-containing protein [Nitrospirae bacterium]|nr:RCC1 repeat-containing protein [Nitrospirota bacterium]
MKHQQGHDSADEAEVEVVAVAGGRFHTVELKSDGTVWAWGRNEAGQLGDGTTVDSPAPIEVTGISDVISVSAGVMHTVALRDDGTVWTWGGNEKGQIGDGTTTDRAAPVQVSGLTDVTAVAAGSYHTIALKSDGSVWAWGWNLFGQLGDGTRTAGGSPEPVQVSGLTDVIAVAAGYGHTVAVKADGTVWAWGGNGSGQLGEGRKVVLSTTPVQVSGLTDVIAVAAGYGHTVAVKADGTVWAWGYNGSGQLGDGTTISKSTPVQVRGITNAVSAVAGFFHTIVLEAGGTVWTWGSNERGQLGVSTTEICEIYVSIFEAPGYTYPTLCSSTPAEVGDLTDVVTVAAGGFHSIAVKNGGTEWAWGYNEDSQLGTPTTDTCGYADEFSCSLTPLQARDKVPGTFSVGGTVSSLTGTLVLQNNGGDDLTVTGNGPFTFTVELEDLDTYHITVLSQPFDQTCSVVSGRIDAADVTDVEIRCYTFTAVTAGGFHSIALEADGTVWAWGYNELGQLGSADGSAYSAVPVQVNDLSEITSVAAGYGHTLALKADGTVWAWGRNASGELGSITTESCQPGVYACSTTPVAVSGLSDVISIGAGGVWKQGYSIALKSDGTVWVWGGNIFGQLANGTSGYGVFNIPEQVDTLTDITAIAAGGSHVLALKADGTVWAWGSNERGQLGVETTETCTYHYPCSTTPVQVSGLTDVSAIAAGYDHSVALKSDGTVWTWGDYSTLTHVSGLTDIISVAAGKSHSMALKGDGTVWAWGGNNSGELGDGTNTDSATPVQVFSLTDVIAVTAGGGHSIALKSDGTAWAWGNNNSGQLGNATLERSSTPVQVETP